LTPAAAEVALLGVQARMLGMRQHCHVLRVYEHAQLVLTDVMPLMAPRHIYARQL
jgi:hypothetical protein